MNEIGNGADRTAPRNISTSSSAAAVDYRAGDFVTSVRQLTADRSGGPGVDIAFDAIGGAHIVLADTREWEQGDAS